MQEWLTAMHDDAQAAGCERCRWASMLAASEAQARHGDLQAAQSLLADWDRRYPEPRPGPAAQRAYVEALLVARSDSAAALPLFKCAAELAERAAQRLLGLWIELDTSAALASVDPPAAIDALREAAASAESIGAASEQQLAAQRLRALGVRTWRRGPTRSNGALSDREQKIAELVAAGASNPEIAKALSCRARRSSATCRTSWPSLALETELSSPRSPSATSWSCSYRPTGMRLHSGHAGLKPSPGSVRPSR
jgi:ATP/maltotriose-dependent transcriptional regulator MalT